MLRRTFLAALAAMPLTAKKKSPVATSTDWISWRDGRWHLPESEPSSEIVDGDPHFGLAQHPVSTDYGIGYWIDLNDTQQ